VSSERRYNEREVGEIFGQAAEAQKTAQDQLSGTEGLTLAELQEIGGDVGITPEFIARAAIAVDSSPPEEAITFLGLPVSAAHTVDIPGEMSDAAWDRLVLDLRKTFRATGRVYQTGSLREWRNGHLHAVVEPIETGHRLHLSTRKGNARGMVFGGLTAFVIGLLMVMLAISDGYAVDFQMIFISLLATLGLGSSAVTAYRLSSWASERERQMKAISERALERAGVEPDASIRTTKNVLVDENSLLEIPDAHTSHNSGQAHERRERSR
jgi:hypothetical protein